MNSSSISFNKVVELNVGNCQRNYLLLSGENTHLPWHEVV